LVTTSATLTLVLGNLCAPAFADTSGALRTLRAALRAGMRQIGGASSAYVFDMSTGQPLFTDAASSWRLPASVQKLYTTTTVLLRFGPQATLSTTVLGQGHRDGHGVWHGTLYLRGGGDPTFGLASFDHARYGDNGATVQTLVSNLVHSTGIKGLQGRIVADASYFDSLRSTAESHFHPDVYMEGELSGLAFDRGFANSYGTSYQPHPALTAARQFASALRDAGVAVPSGIPVSTGKTPAGAQQLAIVRSPTIATLLRLTNTPSDNFFAEMLLKGLGASFGGGGTTADGVKVVRAELSTKFGLTPRFNDGSGLSYRDATTARQVVSLLRTMSHHQVFVSSLAIGGETGTLEYDMQGSGVRGRCRGKTGSLHSVANLSGYCHAKDGHTLVFAFLANRVGNPNYVHSIEANRMAEALIRYDG
jgi:D-alanyl-D-alanine carboxypeptidase/D-alanyl-D-alanine-endopeptidase (penicillin-binding protein 4)